MAERRLDRIARMAGYVLLLSLSACTTTTYKPLEQTTGQDVTQVAENEFRVEYRAGLFTPQSRMDDYIKLRCAEVTLQRGYDYFELGERFDNVIFSRTTSVLLRVHRGKIPEGATLFHDARQVMADLQHLPRD
jgi:hypothetical protein